MLPTLHKVAAQEDGVMHFHDPLGHCGARRNADSDSSECGQFGVFVVVGIRNCC
jgi:hypothetical protein